MNGKTGIVFAIGLLAVLAFSLPAMALSLSNPLVEVSVLRYEPFPAEPGKMADVWLKVENFGKSSPVSVEIVDNYPYTVVDGKWDIGTLPMGEHSILHGRIVVDENAPDGVAKLRVRYDAGGVAVERELEFLVESRPEFRVSGFTSDVPAGIVSDVEVNVSVIKNRAKDVSVSFSSTDFSIIGSSSFYLGEMGKGEERTIRLRVYPSSGKRVGSITMNMTYSYGSGSRGQKVEVLGIEMAERPEIIAVAEENVGKMRIKVVNAGYGTAEFLRLECNGKPEVSYIGNLESDDFDKVAIVPDGREVRCSAIYLDNGVERRKDFGFEFVEPEKKGSYGWIAGIVVVAAAAVFLAVRRK